MAYVFRRVNPFYEVRKANSWKGKFQFFTGTGFPQNADNFSQTVNVPTFKYKADAWDWVNKLGYSKREMEVPGYELVQVRNRAVPGLMKEAKAYNSKLRALRGATAMLAAIYQQAGFSHAAHHVKEQSELVRINLSDRYQLIKAAKEKEYEDAQKSK